MLRNVRNWKFHYIAYESINEHKHFHMSAAEIQRELCAAAYSENVKSEEPQKCKTLAAVATLACRLHLGEKHGHCPSSFIVVTIRIIQPRSMLLLNHLTASYAYLNRHNDISFIRKDQLIQLCRG
jgi:hypothetical protein